jgi:hypothetical protein
VVNRASASRRGLSIKFPHALDQHQILEKYGSQHRDTPASPLRRPDSGRSRLNAISVKRAYFIASTFYGVVTHL